MTVVTAQEGVNVGGKRMGSGAFTEEVTFSQVLKTK